MNEKLEQIMRSRLTKREKPLLIWKSASPIDNNIDYLAYLLDSHRKNPYEFKQECLCTFESEKINDSKSWSDRKEYMEWKNTAR
jgi:hypothetical protein